jgi:hypothetical protein
MNGGRSWGEMLDEIAALKARNRVLVEALEKVRAAIIEKAPDTLWLGLIETAVDCIDAATTERDG